VFQQELIVVSVVVALLALGFGLICLRSPIERCEDGELPEPQGTGSRSRSPERRAAAMALQELAVTRAALLQSLRSRHIAWRAGVICKLRAQPWELLAA